MFISCVAITAATVFSLTVSIHSPNLSLFFNNSFGYIVFIVLTVSTALNLFFDAIYLAHRKTFYTFIVTVIFSILKTIFPFLFISFGPVGIIAAGAFSQFCGIIIHLFITHRQWEYFGNLKFSLFDLHQGWSYTATNYIANLLNLLPACIVPLIVFNKVGAAQAAYYYIVTMIVNLLYVVSNATTKSLFTEGSHSLEQLSLTIKKAVVLISVITIPGILILSLLSNFILNFFGAQYSAFGTYTLLIFGISAIPIGAYALNTALFRIHKQTSELIFCNIMYAALLISTTYVFSKNGLPGIANAWLLSNTIIAGITTIIVFFKKGYR